ncbi:MAG: arginine deiminase-related protein [Spirochaetota bacterium]|nr:arginine deiminase-related protein [Spirochaetota bacterium]
MTKHSIIMGDPFFFSVKGGANPHTRNRFGIKKKVGRELAISQWHSFADTLIDYGLQIFVVPPQLEYPGLVYPANAGFMANVMQNAPLTEKVFYLSNLIPTRAGEQKYYDDLITGLGIKTSTLSRRFEGEADLFPVGNKYIFTHGRIQKQRFKLRFGFPPYKRIYGFRSDYAVLDELKPILGSTPIISITLINESHYHGDTVLCSFGENRQQLLAYLEGLDKSSQSLLKEEFGDYIIPLTEEDARLYAANSFSVSYMGEHFIFMPEGVSQRLLDQISERGVYPVTIDVSEFLNKGGGSIKCMIGDLGVFIDSPEEISENVKDYRNKHRYENYYNKI